MSIDMYYSGRLSEAVSALMMPVMAVNAQANAVYRCAKDAPIAASTTDAIIREAERLENAAATLREAAVIGKPALRLVAAE